MVVDTHIFIWFLLDDNRLPLPIKARMDADPDSVWVPAVCLWELMMLVERGRLSFKSRDPGETLSNFMRECGFREAQLTWEIAVLSRTLPFEHEDPADRFIAATAKSLRMPLATQDTRLRRLSWLSFA